MLCKDIHETFFPLRSLFSPKISVLAPGIKRVVRQKEAVCSKAAVETLTDVRSLHRMGCLTGTSTLLSLAACVTSRK